MKTCPLTKAYHFALLLVFLFFGVGVLSEQIPWRMTPLSVFLGVSVIVLFIMILVEELHANTRINNQRS